MSSPLSSSSDKSPTPIEPPLAPLPTGNPLLQRIVWAMLALLVAGVILFSVRKLVREGAQVAADALPRYETVPEFSLVERSGKEFTRAQLKGSVWIADFFFTTCPGPCPQMSSKMQELQQVFAKARTVRLLSFSIDPQHDTVEVLAAYADRFLAKPDKWFFLTGNEALIHDLARRTFYTAVAPNPAEVVPRYGKFTHGTRFALIDPEGTVRGHYDPFDREFTPRILRDVGSLLTEFGL